MELDYKELFDELLKDWIGCFGVLNTICWLIDRGCSNDEIEEMGFNHDDIFYARNL